MRTLTFKTSKSPDLVFPYLTNTAKFVSVHPVVSNMKYLGDNKYQMFETLKLGVSPISSSYTAFIETCSEAKQVAMTATVMKMNTIKMVFDIIEIPGCAVVKETISIKTKWPVKFTIGQIVKKQHTRLFKNINTLINKM
jgi:hypothetical protein